MKQFVFSSPYTDNILLFLCECCLPMCVSLCRAKNNVMTLMTVCM